MPVPPTTTRRLTVGIVLALSAALVVLVGPAPRADVPPYVQQRTFPAEASSPPVDPRAPYTPTVVSLLKQLEPAQPDPVHDAFPAVGTTQEQLTNADLLLHGTELATLTTPCTGVGNVAVPKGTTPAIAPLCWSDAQGIGASHGLQVRRTTASPIRLGMASSFNPELANAWGQVEGTEGRQLGITGIYGPQVDLNRFPDWARNDPTYGEDPFLHGTMGAAEINGIQGKGLMAQAKHFAFYDGVVTQVTDAVVQDQAAHQVILPPYEYATSGSGQLQKPGLASSLMCSYQRYEVDPAPGVLAPVGAIGTPNGDFACDNQVMNYVTRGQWKWQGFIASDYRLGMDSSVRSITNGNDQEMPGGIFFGDQMVAAVMAHVVPLSTFNRSLARVLYQEERFHLLGHATADSDFLSNSNPSDQEGKPALTPAQVKAGAAVTELAAEQSAVLLKNSGENLPLTASDLKHGVLVLGTPAEYMPASPGAERANGTPERDAISPLQQLKQFAGPGSKITYLSGVPTPAAADGQVVPQAVLSADGSKVGTGLSRTAGPGSPRVDRQLDFTSVSGNGQLLPGGKYQWTGFVNVPAQDDYTFHFQYTARTLVKPPSAAATQGNSCTDGDSPTFSLATDAGQGKQLKSQSLSSSSTAASGAVTNTTMSGNTERGLVNCLVSLSGLTPGLHQLQIDWNTPAKLVADDYNRRVATLPSLRFGYSRAAGDLTDTVALAKQARKVVIFVDAAGGGVGGGFGGLLGTDTVGGFDTATNALIDAISSANAATAVVMNVAVPTLSPWATHVKSLMQLWWPGSEGGTATARLLLGLVNPSGHLPVTWPANSTDTISQYAETVPLYSGDTPGPHPERFQAGEVALFDEGLFIGYRFFDREQIVPQYPFGWGLSYTTFRLSNVSSKHAGGGMDVSFDVTNTGKVVGATVPQVYVGPAPKVPSGVQQVERSLSAFERVFLQPGQTRRLTLHVGAGSGGTGAGDRRAFQYWDSPTQQWVTTTGCRTLFVGTANHEASLVTAKGSADPKDKGCATAAARAATSDQAGGRPSNGDGGLAATGGVPGLATLAVLLIAAALVGTRARRSRLRG